MALKAAFAAALAVAAYGATDEATAKRWVAATNAYRCWYGQKNVGWSQAAADDAQTYVNTLSTPLTAQSYSPEPLCLDPPAGPAAESLAEGQPNLEAAVAFWASQEINCRKSPTGAWNGCAPPGFDNQDVQRFTALVWQGVTQIGCASNATTGIYICRYKSGDTIGPWTANQPAFYRDNVKPKDDSKTLEECREEANANVQLSPTLPDVTSMYPNVPDISDAMTVNLACPFKPGEPSNSGRAGYFESSSGVKTSKQVVAIISVVVFCVCCICCTCYSCRFIHEKHTGRLTGTLSSMRNQSYNQDKEPWRFNNYLKSQEDRIKDYTPAETLKDARKGAKHSGIPGSGIFD